ncbi:hypothetical protein TIFTF001_039676 [Ficus carica]|uniref:Uncharacterized protein n=1 Tax=Ficus carica TaxID=3494 RepID=A0AA88EBA7_FICCA|nr:hypothetical protein TIFTF001_039676 [Ficus carica]
MEISDFTILASVATSSETCVATPPSTSNETPLETDGLYYSDFECNSGDEELNDDDIEKAYQEMYSK